MNGHGQFTVSLALMHEDIHVAADQIIVGADKKGIVLRLLGGMAIRMRCPEAAKHPALIRNIPDIDLITRKKHSKALADLFSELGLKPVSMFNALHGDRRLLFMEENGTRQVDVFLDVFEMCHKFDFLKRMPMDEKTLPLADLLLTKLQIIEINEKDYKDVICLFLDHPISEKDDREALNAAYIAGLCARDWGIWRTITRNLQWVREFVPKLEMEDDKKQLIVSRIDALLARIEKEPKGMGWRMRARIGDKMVWYDTPDRVGKITLDQ